jgi:hypothetical protein
MPVREIKLLMDSRLRWQGVEWEIVGTPWMLNSGMMLRLRRERWRRQHLWLAADSMDAQEWRDLRRLICNNRRSSIKLRRTVRPFHRESSHQFWIRSSLRSYWLVSSSARPTNSWPSAMIGLGW